MRKVLANNCRIASTSAECLNRRTLRSLVPAASARAIVSEREDLYLARPNLGLLSRSSRIDEPAQKHLTDGRAR